MVVRMRSTRSHTGHRRSHHKLSVPSGRHRVDPKTGIYRGRKVVDMAKKVLKKAKRLKEREKEAMR